jgi:U3 small nucleolar RNA-associated protein 10
MNEKVSLTQWYSRFLKSLEQQYAETFDKIIKEIMSSDEKQQNSSPQLTESKRNALKTVLSFLLKVSHTHNDTSIFENLYHHNENRRAEAVKYLIENLEKIQIAEGGGDLVKDSLVERLSDDSPLVVLEVLAVRPSILVKTLTAEGYFQKLEHVLEKCLQNIEKWGQVLPKVVASMTDKAIAKVDEAKILLAIFPLLFPSSEANMTMVGNILQSSFGKRNKFLATVAGQWNQKNTTFASISKAVHTALQRKNLLPPFEALQRVLPVEGSSFSKMYFNTFLLIHSLSTDNESTIEVCHQLLDGTTAKLAQLEADDPNGGIKFADAFNSKYDILPSDILVLLIKRIIECLATQAVTENLNVKQMDLVNQSVAVGLKLKIFEILLTKFFEATQFKDKAMMAVYGKVLKEFLDLFHVTFDDKVEFLSHFYLGQAIKPEPLAVGSEQQSR